MLADKAARETAKTSSAHILVALPPFELLAIPKYTTEDIQDQVKCQGIYRKDEWLHTTEVFTFLQGIYKTTHVSNPSGFASGSSKV